MFSCTKYSVILRLYSQWNNKTVTIIVLKIHQTICSKCPKKICNHRNRVSPSIKIEMLNQLFSVFA